MSALDYILIGLLLLTVILILLFGLTTFEYFLITVPIYLWYLFKSDRKDFTKGTCSLFQSVVYNRANASSLVELQQDEENRLLSILKERTHKSLHSLQEGPVSFTPFKAKRWNPVGSATILCEVGDAEDCQRILLTVRYRQRLRVKPWLIVEIAEADK